MPIRTLDISHLDTSGAQFGANLTYVASNARFEWVSGTYTPTPVAPSGPYAYGSTSSYTAGGYSNPADNPLSLGSVHNYIFKFSFASIGAATEVGQLAVDNRQLSTGASSATHGYAMKGNGPPAIFTPIAATWNDKFSFSSDSNATQAGDNTTPAWWSASTESPTSAYTMGGNITPSTYTDSIEKHLFSSDTTGVDAAELISAIARNSGAASASTGYNFGGHDASNKDKIQIWPFSSDSPATDVGEMVTGASFGFAQNSDTHAYHSGGYIGPANSDTIGSIPFSSNTPATDVGEISAGRYRGVTGTSSTTHGYVVGGRLPTQDTIDRFPFSSNTPATDVGELGIPGITDAAGAQT